MLLSFTCQFADKLKTFATTMTNEIMVETQLHHYACVRDAHVQWMTIFSGAFSVVGQHESSYIIRLLDHIHRTIVDLAVQTQLPDLFGDSCACNSGVTQQKLQQFLIDIQLSSQNINCSLCCTDEIITQFAFQAYCTVFPRLWEYFCSVLSSKRLGFV